MFALKLAEYSFCLLFLKEGCLLLERYLCHLKHAKTINYLHSVIVEFFQIFVLHVNPWINIFARPRTQ
jgi:hypothetical protein